MGTCDSCSPVSLADITSIQHTEPTSPQQHLWSEVDALLNELHLAEYNDVLKAEGYDRMEALYTITIDDLREMKIKRGHTKILLNHIKQHKNSNSTPSISLHKNNEEIKDELDNTTSQQQILYNTKSAPIIIHLVKGYQQQSNPIEMNETEGINNLFHIKEELTVDIAEANKNANNSDGTPFTPSDMTPNTRKKRKKKKRKKKKNKQRKDDDESDGKKKKRKKHKKKKKKKHEKSSSSTSILDEHAWSGTDIEQKEDIVMVQDYSDEEGPPTPNGSMSGPPNGFGNLIFDLSDEEDDEENDGKRADEVDDDGDSDSGSDDEYFKQRARMRAAAKSNSNKSSKMGRVN